jgi:exodeoxyribonuclease VII small subunit
MAKKSEKAGGEAPAGGPPAFEAALAELEDIVQQLEAGEKSLDESLKLYERGVAALRACHQLLDQAEQRIRKLVAGPGGQPLVQDLKLSPARAAGQEGEALPAEQTGAPDAEGAQDPGAPQGQGSAGEHAAEDPGGAAEKKPRPAGRPAPRAQNPGEPGARGEGTSRKGDSLFGGG